MDSVMIIKISEDTIKFAKDILIFSCIFWGVTVVSNFITLLMCILMAKVV